ncbi:MAG: DUF1501 domain-containing protein [Myxococcota bacterium]|nr:DUF1501 domain-containing protein [Myxococcota bacterium]
MKQKFTRRQLLHHGISLGALSAAGRLSIPSLAYADTQPSLDRNFIFCYFSGGWDVFLGLDPKDPDVFTDERKYETRVELGFHKLPSNYRSLVESSVPNMVFGPYIGNLVQHADKISLVRGMSVDALGHAAGAARFLTGKPPSGNNARGSSLATFLSDIYGSERLISNLCLRMPSYNVDRSPKATAAKVWSVEDLFDFVERSEAPFNDSVFDAVDDFLQNHTNTHQSTYLEKALEYKIKMREMTALNLRTEFDLEGSSSDIATVREAFQLDYSNLNNEGFNDSNYRAAIAARAIISGASRCVSVEIVSGLDSHYDWSVDQGPRQESGFNTMANLLTYLDSVAHSNGGSYLDHTTILCYSEMGRTPMMFKDGRNHNRTTSCFLAGAGIKKGAVIGASSDLGAGCQKVDLNTGDVSEAGEIIRPEHIHQSLLYSIGITEDAADLRVPPLHAILT